MKFGTHIHNTKLENGVKYQSVIMQDIYVICAGWWINHNTKLRDFTKWNLICEVAGSSSRSMKKAYKLDGGG